MFKTYLVLRDYIKVRSIVSIVILILVGIGSAEASEVTFITNKQVYDVGENINFVLTNVGTDTIVLPSTAPWYIVDDNFNNVYSPIGSLIIIDISPGGSKVGSWYQNYTNNTQVPQGYYYAVYTWYPASIWTIQYSYARFYLGNSGIVQGRVKCSGIAKSGAVVSSIIESTTTNELGNYSIHVPAGTYFLQAYKDPECYQNNSIIVYTTQGSTLNKDIDLTIKPTGTISGNIVYE